MIVAGTHASFEQDRGPRGKHSACGALCPGNFHLIGGYCIGSGGNFVRQRRSAVFSGPAKVINFRKAMILVSKKCGPVYHTRDVKRGPAESWTTIPRLPGQICRERKSAETGNGVYVRVDLGG